MSEAPLKCLEQNPDLVTSVVKLSFYCTAAREITTEEMRVRIGREQS